MKYINLKDYNTLLGTLIDVQHPLDYAEKHDPRSINIYADKLLLNHKTLLNKNQKYFIMCRKGFLSRKVVSMLSYLGYDVVLVIN